MQKIRQPEATNEKLRPERFRDGVVNLQGKPSMDRHHRQTADAEGHGGCLFRLGGGTQRLELLRRPLRRDCRRGRGLGQLVGAYAVVHPPIVAFADQIARTDHLRCFVISGLAGIEHIIEAGNLMRETCLIGELIAGDRNLVLSGIVRPFDERRFRTPNRPLRILIEEAISDIDIACPTVYSHLVERVDLDRTVRHISQVEGEGLHFVSLLGGRSAGSQDRRTPVIDLVALVVAVRFDADRVGLRLSGNLRRSRRDGPRADITLVVGAALRTNRGGGGQRFERQTVDILAAHEQHVFG